MIFEDRFGRLYMSEEVDELSAWEIEERGLHMADLRQRPEFW